VMPIYHGDCVAGMNALPAEYADCIVADPPYRYGLDYGSGSFNDGMSDAAFLAFTHSWVSSAVRVLSPVGSLWILAPDEWLGETIVYVKRLGLTVQNLVVWHESFGVQTTKKFARTKRTWVYATKHPSRRTFNRVYVPSKRQTEYQDPRANPLGKTPDDVWTEFPRVCGTFAERVPNVPTQLPLAMVERIVTVSTNVGEMVIDPFSGSGTTAVACQRLNRRFKCYELSAEYVAIGNARLAQIPPSVGGIL